jgi:ATP-dependent protease ClpP protease subunit
MLRLYRGKKTGVVVCYARSVAAVILQACDLRHCPRHSKVLIHHVSAGEFMQESISLDFLSTRKNVENLISEMSADQRQLYRILCARTGRKVAEVKRACQKNKDFSAEEAKKFGLIDEVV